MKVLVVSAAVEDEGLARNIGDEGLTDGLVSILHDHGHTVLASLNGGGRNGADGRVDLSKIPNLIRAVRWADHVVIGGGTLFAAHVGGASLTLRGHARYLGAVTAACRGFGRPWSIVGVGAERWPRGLEGRVLRQVVTGARHVSVRDGESAQVMKLNTGRDVAVGGDTFFGSVLPKSEAEGAPYAVVALSGRTTPEQVQAVAAFMVGLEIAEVRVRRMDQAGDDEASAIAVTQRLRELGASADVSPVARSWVEVYREIAGAEVVIASRLHAHIFAARAAVPSVVVGRGQKLIAFAQAAGLPLIGEGAPRTARRDYLDSQVAGLKNAVARLDA